MGKLLYETYKKEEDVFYTDFVEYEDAPLERLLQYEDIYLDMPDILMTDSEMVLRRAFHTKWLTQGEDIERTAIVILLLLCVPYITSEALCGLHIFPNDNGAKRFLSAHVYSEKNRNGCFRSFQMQGNRIRKGYTLTNAAREEMLSQLPKEYVKTKLKTSKKACSGTNGHDALCCNLYYYLLSDYAFAYFDWYNSPYFDTSKSFKENVEIMQGMPVAGTTGFRPDAFIVTLEKYRKYLYVEQDMKTEISSKLTEKFKNYVTLFNTQTLDEISASTLIISIYADKGKDMSRMNSADIKKEKGVTLTRTKRNCNELLLFIHMLANGDKSNLTVSDVKKRILVSMNNNADGNHSKMITNHFRNAYCILEEFIDKHPGEESVIELEKYMDELLMTKKNQVERKENQKSEKAFLSRKQTFRSIVADMPDMQMHLQNGLRLVVIDTLHPQELNNVLLTHHSDDVLENRILPCIETKMGLSGDRMIRQSIDFGGGIHFCNYCTYESAPGKHMVFENISSDIGAWYRLQKFVNRVETMPKGELCVFILASNMEDIKEFEKSIWAEGTIAKRYADPKNVLKPKTNISFTYFCYGAEDGTANWDKPFVLDLNGEPVYL